MASKPVAPASDESTTPGKIDPRIERLFLRLSAIYGYLWWNIYQNEELLRMTKKEWSASLKRFNDQILKNVLLGFREKKGNPPSLPEFFESCIAMQKRLQPFTVAPPEPFQRGDLAIAQGNLKEIYAALSR